MTYNYFCDFTVNGNAFKRFDFARFLIFSKTGILENFKYYKEYVMYGKKPLIAILSALVLTGYGGKRQSNNDINIITTNIILNNKNNFNKLNNFKLNNNIKTTKNSILNIKNEYKIFNNLNNGKKVLEV
ncbi:MAG: hypothetical protein LBG21_03865 [Campylobacteraceae bacterium]|jgi:hypothetical protein|nr:hypothetical protein [Campylobacteraceae bacterium]